MNGKTFVLVAVAGAIAGVLVLRSDSRPKPSSITDYIPVSETVVASPEERVEHMIKDWYHWWSATNDDLGSLAGLSAGNSATQMDRFRRLESWLELEADVVARNFTPDVSQQHRPSGFGAPAQHHPDHESVIEVSMLQDNEAVVETETDVSGRTEWFEYRVVKVDGDWRIRDVIAFSDPRDASITAPARRTKLLNSIGNTTTSVDVDVATVQRLEKLFVEQEVSIGEDETATIDCVAAGAVSVESGTVGVFDFGWGGDMFRPLQRSVPIGSYEIQIAVADFNGADSRNSAARMLIGDPDSVSRWVTAETVEEPGHVVDVDYGNVAIFDATDYLELKARKLERLYQQYLDLRFDDSTAGKKHVHLQFGKKTASNCIVMDSGMGDGGYPAYWGLDDADNPVVLLVDFLLIDYANKN